MESCPAEPGAFERPAWPEMTLPRILLAGVTSGCGKTIAVSAILRALQARGLRAQPFKTGPDYIDPSYHSCAAGLPSRTLDAWLLPSAALRELFARAAAAADLSVIEGMMGFYDGRDDTDAGSSAELAKLLETPVILMIDAGKTSRTAAAVALGCQRYDPQVKLAGFILNRVAGDLHYRWCAGPITDATGLPVLGYLPEEPSFALPERHLGLVPMAEGRIAEELFVSLARQAEQTVDLDGVLKVARSAPPLAEEASGLFPAKPVPARARIALARDEAFSFYYEDTLDLLRAWGADLAAFSPLADTDLPAGTSGVYIGGGFPELYARQLSTNRPLLNALRGAAERGLPVYAECGGLMYLCEGIVDLEGARHRMAGLIGGWSTLDGSRLSIGYRDATALRSSFLLSAGERVRGHEFHWSQMREPVPEESAAYRFDGVQGRCEGYASGGILATYLHLHFGADARLAPRFVSACAGGH